MDSSIEVLLNWNIVMHQLLKCRGINPILIHTPTTTSTWLCPETFRHWIRNSDSSTSKHSELLVSHHDDCRSRDTYAHILREQPLTVEYSIDESLVQWQCILISHLYAISVSSYSLVTRKTNLYGTQWPTLDKHHRS